MKLSKHDDHCREIANRIEDIFNGLIVRCENCSVEFHLHEDATESEDGEIICPNCGHEGDDYETVSMYNYLEDAYDFEISCSISGDYRSARIMIACGGPNIYINTKTRQVELFWWNESGSWSLFGRAADEIDSCVSELFEMSR